MNTKTQPRTVESVRAEVIANAPVLYRTVYAKAFDGNSKATALKAKCLDCCCNVRAEITNCAAYGCPLWSYRPYQAGTDDADADGEPTAENQVVEGGAA